jgi:T5SS/PEP-CTERM-associated repeat protein
MADDTYQWKTPGNGTFDVASQWTDLTNPGSVAFPGASDTANLVGPLSGPAQTITGPGDVAALNVDGLNLLSGAFTTGLTRVDNVAGAASLELAGSLSASAGVIVGDAGTGALTVENAATLTGSSADGTDQVVIGNAVDSSGSITVAAGGTLDLTGPATTAAQGLVVGNDGTASLTVTGSGATVNDERSDGVAVGLAAGSSGLFLVSDGATAEFSTTNNALLGAVSVGRGGTGTLEVDGAGSRLTANGTAFFGRSGSGVLVVSNSGVLDETAAADNVQVGWGNNSNNSHVGGTGTATITSKGTLLAAGKILIGGFGVDGSVTASDGGLITTASQIVLGDSVVINSTPESGNGTLDVDAGGTVQTTGVATPGTAEVVAGVSAQTNGTINVSGAGAVLNAGSNEITVGVFGTGELNVSAGGAVTASSPGSGFSAIALAASTDSVGTLSVSGVGSTVSAAGVLSVGVAGSGTLLLSDGAQISAANVFLGHAAGGHGSASVSDGTLIAAGSVEIGGTTWTGTLAVSGGLVDAADIGVGIGSGVTLSGGTLSATGTVSLNGGGVLSGSGVVDGAVDNTGTITASGGTLTLSGAVTNNALDIARSSDLVLDSSVSGGNVDFSGGGERLDLLAPGGFSALVNDFTFGDTIFASGAASIDYNGSLAVTLLNGSNAPIGTIDLGQAVAAGDTLVDSGGTITLACFAAGTRIATPAGTVAVEALRVGESVRLADGGTAPVIWLGHRRVDCARHARPWDVMPVRVRAHAFGPGRPHADLLLSPDHAVLQGGHLIPVRYLVNGRTIAQERVEHITYWHVELPRHGVVLAEGLPAESYLDTGNRAAFANGAAAVQLHPDFARRAWQAQACAPLLLDGPRIAAAKRRLLARARRLGDALTDDPGLTVLADGRALPTERTGQQWRVRLPLRGTAVRLVSRSWIPAHTRPNECDTRRLGVAISRIWLDRRAASLDSAGFGAGWHAPEADWRWTDGNAELALHGVRELAFEVAMTGTYWRDEPARTERAA